jgi:hypothetical protein
MDIILQTNSHEKRLELRNCKKFGDGSGYAVSIFARSGNFSAEIDFYFEEYPLEQFLKNLALMSRTLKGTAILKPMWEDDFVEVKALNLGHISVTGELSQLSDYSQKLSFGFETDQTALAPFVEQLSNLSATNQVV